LGPPPNALQRKSVAVLEDAAHPEARSVLKGVQADPATDEVRGRFDPRIGPAEDIGMAKAPVRKDRDGDEWPPRLMGDEVGGEGEFAHVKLFVFEHPAVSLRGSHGLGNEVDSLRPDGLLDKGPNEIRIAAGKRDLQLHSIVGRNFSTAV
jgi:hypothetical protein